MWYTFEGWLEEARIVPAPWIVGETEHAHQVINHEGKKSWRPKRDWYGIFPSYEAARDRLIATLHNWLVLATNSPEEVPFPETKLTQMRIRLTELEIEAEQAVS